MKDIEIGYHPPIAQKSYTLPFKHIKWVKEELEMLEKSEIITHSVLP